MTRQTTPSILDDLMRADERIQQLPIDALDDNPYQRRSASVADDDPDLLNLSTDIAQQGIIQHLIVRPHPNSRGRYQIAAGHRRRLAARLAGLEHVPCVVRTLTDDQMLDVVFAENYHRADINPIDRAELMQLLADQGLTQQQIADRFSVSRPTVANALRLLQLPSEIQADVVAGKISNRQAEALIPLATLPPEAQQTLNGFLDLDAMIEKARSGCPSDKLRDLVQASVLYAAKTLPDHWRNYAFYDLAEAIQPRCAGCAYIRTVKDEDRCTMPPCWHAKSSAWQAIEQGHIVALTGVTILSQGVSTNYDMFYGDALRLLGLPSIAANPPAHQCESLRVRKNYNGDWSFCCHYGANGSTECTCLAAARKSDGANNKRALKQITADTDATLKRRLAAFPLDALRILASKYGKWEHRNQVVTWDDEQCATVIANGLIKDRLPYDAEKNLAAARTAMEHLLAIAGARAPWLPPLEQEIAEQLSAVRTWLDDYLDPGDGTPTPDSIAATIEQLRTLADTILRVSEPQRQRLFQRQSGLWLDAIALQERVQVNYDRDSEI